MHVPFIDLLRLLVRDVERVPKTSMSQVASPAQPLFAGCSAKVQQGHCIKQIDGAERPQISFPMPCAWTGIRLAEGSKEGTTHAVSNGDA